MKSLKLYVDGPGLFPDSTVHGSTSREPIALRTQFPTWTRTVLRSVTSIVLLAWYGLRSSRRCSKRSDDYEWLYEKQIPATRPAQTRMEDDAFTLATEILIFIYVDGRRICDRVIPVPEIDDSEMPRGTLPREMETNRGMFVTNCHRHMDHGKVAFKMVQIDGEMRSHVIVPAKDGDTNVAMEGYEADGNLPSRPEVPRQESLFGGSPLQKWVA